MRATVRDPARARRAAPPHHCQHLCDNAKHDVLTMYLHLILRCFRAKILTPYHPQPLGPLTSQIHRAARHHSSP